VNAEAKIDSFLLKRLAEQSGQCLDMASVLLATDEMLKAAQSGSWDRVSELESSRRKRLDRCFMQPIMPENSEFFSEALAVMLHLNEELVAVVQQAREQVSVSRNQHAKKKEALRHYLDTSSD
jgi:hypothetical protein